MSQKFPIAVIQASPVFLNLSASLDKACELIAEAAKGGARLAVFGETWLPGYPAWIDSAPATALWGHPPAKAIFRRLFENSPELGKGSETLRRLTEAAGRHRCDVVMGLNERDGSTLYNSMLFLGRDGETARVHRKLVPTYTERMMWGRGDGSHLVDLPTPDGTVGGLICWEHWMPLARAALHARGETVHVAQWPTVHELHQIASRHYAFEGGCFVAAAGSVLTKAEAIGGYLTGGEDAGLEVLRSIEGADGDLLLRGGSAIIAPDTSYVAEPVYAEERVITAELDLAMVAEASLTLDTAGHYSRPDVFDLRVNVQPQGGVNFVGDPSGEAAPWQVSDEALARGQSMNGGLSGSPEGGNDG